MKKGNLKHYMPIFYTLSHLLQKEFKIFRKDFSRTRYSKFIASFLTVLMITLPFYSANVNAVTTIDGVSTVNQDGIEGFVKDVDVITFEATFFIDEDVPFNEREEPTTSNQVWLEFLGGLGDPFNGGCIDGPLQTNICTTTISSNDFSGFENAPSIGIYDYKLRLFKSVDVPGDGSTPHPADALNTYQGTIYLEELPPDVTFSITVPSDITLTTPVKTTGYVEFDYSIQDYAYDNTPNRCSGIDRIEFYEMDTDNFNNEDPFLDGTEIQGAEVVFDTSDCTKSTDIANQDPPEPIVTHDFGGFSRIVTVCARAVDQMGLKPDDTTLAGTDCATVIVDAEPPQAYQVTTLEVLDPVTRTPISFILFNKNTPATFVVNITSEVFDTNEDGVIDASDTYDLKINTVTADLSVFNSAFPDPILATSCTVTDPTNTPEITTCTWNFDINIDSSGTRDVLVSFSDDIGHADSVTYTTQNFQLDTTGPEILDITVDKTFDNKFYSDGKETIFTASFTESGSGLDPEFVLLRIDGGSGIKADSCDLTNVCEWDVVHFVEQVQEILCVTGFTCENDQWCRLSNVECVTDDQCDPVNTGKSCVNGICHIECSTDSTLCDAAGKECVGGVNRVCRLACTDGGSECGADTCANGYCHKLDVECIEDSHCSVADDICVQGLCQEFCVIDLSCSDGEACINNACKPACTDFIAESGTRLNTQAHTVTIHPNTRDIIGNPLTNFDFPAVEFLVDAGDPQILCQSLVACEVTDDCDTEANEICSNNYCEKLCTAGAQTVDCNTDVTGETCTSFNVCGLVICTDASQCVDGACINGKCEQSCMVQNVEFPTAPNDLIITVRVREDETLPTVFADFSEISSNDILTGECVGPPPPITEGQGIIWDCPITVKDLKTNFINNILIEFVVEDSVGNSHSFIQGITIFQADDLTAPNLFVSSVSEIISERIDRHVVSQVNLPLFTLVSFTSSNPDEVILSKVLESCEAAVGGNLVVSDENQFDSGEEFTDSEGTSYGAGDTIPVEFLLENPLRIKDVNFISLGKDFLVGTPHMLGADLNQPYIVTEVNGDSEDLLDADVIKVNCTIALLVRDAQRIYSVPEIEPFTIYFSLFDTPGGTISDAVQRQVDRVKDRLESLDNEIGVLVDNTDALRSICSIASAVGQIDGIVQTVFTVITGVTCALMPPTLGASATAWYASCGPMNSFHYWVRTAVWDPGIVPIAHTPGVYIRWICSIYTCRLADPNFWADIGAFVVGASAGQFKSDTTYDTVTVTRHTSTSPKVTAETPTASIGDVDETIDGTTTGSPWTSSGERTQMNHALPPESTFFDPYRSRHYAKELICIPGVIYNLRKEMQINCLKVTCLEENAAAGVSTAACHNAFKERMCLYVDGALYKIYGSALTFNFFKRLIDLFWWNLRNNFVGTVIAIADAVCIPWHIQPTEECVLPSPCVSEVTGVRACGIVATAQALLDIDDIMNNGFDFNTYDAQLEGTDFCKDIDF